MVKKKKESNISKEYKKMAKKHKKKMRKIQRSNKLRKIVSKIV